MNRILIVSYSMTGTTWKASCQLAENVKADRDPIVPIDDPSGLLRTIWALAGALLRREPEIEPPRHDPADYDLVVLATPVWAGRMASPMRTYIVNERERFRRVAFLCTQGGSGARAVFEEMSFLCGQHPVATLALLAKDIDRGDAKNQLSGFGRTLAQCLSGAPDGGRIVSAA